jgi:ubiquinone/menaquinone biosynthesis C-methylase UbiE
VLPRLVEATCGQRDLDRWRERAVAGLSGAVLELGFGSGLNVHLYPPEVTTVFAVEPSGVARQRSASRIAASGASVEFVGLDGAQVPLADDSCDAALCTFTLCTIPDADAALAEVRRIVRPGGTFHFLEHGEAPDAGVRRWQHRLDGVQQRLAGGCHLTRDPTTLVTAAGLELVEVERRYVRGPKPWTWFSVGRAVVPA